ncbi:MAG: FecR domain-containing protein [Gammaproteobacteria bacterium]
MRSVRQPSAPGPLGRVRSTVNAAELRLLRFAAALLAMAAPPAPAQPCDPPAARVVSAQGEVEASYADVWRPVRLDQALCSGQKLRIQANSRAVLVLPNETQVHLDAGTILTLTATQPSKPGWLELLRGALHIITRVPRALSIRTPYANAGVEGTEFVLRVRRNESQLWVYEGRVRFDNKAGTLVLTSGEAAFAERGRAPQRRIVVRPRKAVEWALYYPPVIDTRPERVPDSPAKDAIRAALRDYRAGNITRALQRLESVPATDRNAYTLGVRAGLYLSIGRVPKAEHDILSILQRNPRDATALALRSIIAIVRNEAIEAALRDARAAVQAEPRSPTPYVALSYAQQAAFDIEAALASLEQASRYAPQDALVWARLSELELSRADLDAALAAARRAEQLDPRLARTQAVLGFAQLMRIDIDAAQRHFEQAIRLDPADPLPRLGMGLARIRDGNVDAGTKEIEIAASLDPNNSLVRSYLGKAYFEQKRGGLAETEFEQAKRLDPKDPTPWFYDAIHKQTTNRPVEALHDLRKAIDLNDNRAVYRSRLLLDEDLAARSAASGRIYRDLGFEQPALLQGWKSVNTNPRDYSAHRLLADAYSILPRHEIARVSELMQSQLRQPLNITPIQPQLAESDLFLLPGAGVADPAFNEFNPLFASNRLGLQASGTIGSNDTFGDEVTHSGIWNDYSYSLGQFHYETDGFRENNDLEQNVFNLFSQYSVSSADNLQIELRHTDIDEGDRILRFFEDDFRARLRQERETESARLGYRHAFMPNSDLLLSFIYKDTDARFDNTKDRISSFNVDFNSEAYLLESQYTYSSAPLILIAGGGHFTTNGRRLVFTSPSLQAVGLDPVLLDDNENVSLTTVYSYLNVAAHSKLILTLGLSADFFNGTYYDHDQVNPKIGLLWQPFDATTIRMAAFRTLSKESLDITQTIEPTQVAGFNQLFGTSQEQDLENTDRQGIDMWRYGIGIDQSIHEGLRIGMELSKQDLEVPGRFIDSDDKTETEFTVRWDEVTGRAYLSWTPTSWFAGGAQYFFESFDRGTRLARSSGISELESERIPLQVAFFHPSGFSTRFTGSYYVQDGVFALRNGPFEPGEDNFWLLDAAIRYRIPSRTGVVSVGVNNLLDEEFSYQETDPSRPVVNRGETWYASIILSY